MRISRYIAAHCLILASLSVLLAIALPVNAAGLDNNVEWDGISHIEWQDRRPLCPVGNEAFSVRCKSSSTLRQSAPKTNRHFLGRPLTEFFRAPEKFEAVIGPLTLSQSICISAALIAGLALIFVRHLWMIGAQTEH